MPGYEEGRAGRIACRGKANPGMTSSPPHSHPAPPGPSASASTGPTQPAIRVIMMPKDTNALGTIFGGIILSYIDQAGAVEAHRHGPGRLVTVAMREVVFHAPVFVGDLVSFFTETLRIGRTSIAVKVVVEAERLGRGKVKVTEAEVVYVHVDASNQPMPILLAAHAAPAAGT
jgi:acyl-CoA thioesterase YciA